MGIIINKNYNIITKQKMSFFANLKKSAMAAAKDAAKGAIADNLGVEVPEGLDEIAEGLGEMAEGLEIDVDVDVDLEGEECESEEEEEVEEEEDDEEEDDEDKKKKKRTIKKAV